jgi:hypothetical protein
MPPVLPGSMMTQTVDRVGCGGSRSCLCLGQSYAYARPAYVRSTCEGDAYRHALSLRHARPVDARTAIWYGDTAGLSRPRRHLDPPRRWHDDGLRAGR